MKKPILLVASKEGAVRADQWTNLKASLEELGYEIVPFTMGSVANVHADLRIEVLPGQNVPWWRRLMGATA